MTPTLLGPNGQPISSKGKAGILNKKADPPKTGDAFGAWAGRDLDFMRLPGGGLVQFDLSKLTLQDYRTMRDHYQVNASLAVLSFMQHQSDFHIECEDKKIATFTEDNLRNNWTGLNRAMSQSNWAGHSPSALEWENEGRNVVLTKVKDLVPEECRVNWKEEEGWAPPDRTPPKFKTYDGIMQFGTGWPIPVENSFWYPLLMENGDYDGRKLLRPAFQSWFFSILVHLFANRYFERFGEPVPVGRAPFDEEINIEGQQVRGNTYLLKVLQDLRNRSVVVLPNDKTEMGNGVSSFDYDIEYLESQMRGADFERYMTRLDEEISIGLFTPILLLRTADVGSYSLGVGHMQMYLWMLNAMNDDRKVYIDKYLLAKMADYNFGPNSARPKIVFRKLGNSNQEMIKEVLTALIQQGKATVNLEELGQMAGMTITEVRQTLEDTPATGTPAEGDPAPATGDAASATGGNPSTSARATAKEVVDRVRPQVDQAFRNGLFREGLAINMGYKRKMERALEADGYIDSVVRTNDLYDEMDNWLAATVTFGAEEFSSPDSFVSLFETKLVREIERVTGAAHS